MDKIIKIAVIGGGASGLMAAIAAKDEHTAVTVYEKEKRVGRKILATGNGRCNMTNINASELDYHGSDVSFMRDVIDKFWVGDTLLFFQSLGVVWKEEDGGKVYPYSDTASAVLDVLRRETELKGVEILCERAVKNIVKKGKNFTVTDSSGVKLNYDKVIVATGGKAGSQLGSDGSGYALLKSFGHKITSVYPSLVQIKTETETVKKLKGIKVNATVSLGDKSKTGELLFTEYGISGPPVFWLSSYLYDNKEVAIDIMPEYTYSEIYDMLKKRVNVLADIALEDFFVGMLNKRVSQAFLKHAGIEPLSRKASSLSDKELKTIVSVIKGMKLKICGTSSWNNAQVTKGGALVSEFNSETMQSKLVKGLYACGELLDIDGDCGGYNLQWAWSSGYVAGCSASGKEVIT